MEAIRSTDSGTLLKRLEKLDAELTLITERLARDGSHQLEKHLLRKIEVYRQIKIELYQRDVIHPDKYAGM